MCPHCSCIPDAPHALVSGSPPGGNSPRSPGCGLGPLNCFHSLPLQGRIDGGLSLVLTRASYRPSSILSHSTGAEAAASPPTHLTGAPISQRSGKILKALIPAAAFWEGEQGSRCAGSGEEERTLGAPPQRPSGAAARAGERGQHQIHHSGPEQARLV